MTAKKAVPAAPEIDPAALVPERPESKVEAGLKAVTKTEAETKPSASEQGQAMLAEDAAAAEELIEQRAAEIATATLVKLGVPEEVARLAVAGDLDAARAAAEGVTTNADGELCAEGCFPNGWDALPFDSVGCAHGNWKR
jgi:hypothetical protein